MHNPTHYFNMQNDCLVLELHCVTLNFVLGVVSEVFIGTTKGRL